MSESRKRTPTDQQARVIESWGRGLAVNAGAGTGKSTTLVAKCQELLKTEGRRFAAVSFTEKSASELKTRLLKEGIRLGSSHWVSTIHGLCGSIVREFPREAGFDGEERLLSEVESRQVWARALEPLWFDGLGGEGGVEGLNRSVLERLLDRERRDEVENLLARIRGLSGLGIIEKMREQAHSEKPDLDVESLRILSEWALDRYDRMKRRLGAIDFDDLEKGARRALEHEFVAATYHKRFDLVMVDEFQDTNPIQAAILERFVRPDLSNLVVVGDPKQSIYRFRDADVSIFNELCARLGTKISLTKNFRSDPRIIDFVNAVCAPLFEASKLDYEPLEAGLGDLGEAEAIIRVPIQYPSDLARFIANEVARGLHLGQMVILLKRIKGREEWIKGLSKAGVPLAISSGGFFYSDPRVVELVSFLRWWFEPHQKHSGAIFLRSPWVGVSDRQLDEWLVGDGVVSLLKQKFLNSDHPMARALASVKENTLTPGSLLMELLIDDRIETEIGMHVLQLWHRCEEWSSNGMSALDIVRELTRKITHTEREGEIPPPSTQGQLRILTIHASKGLEFEHVILPDLKKSAQRARPMPLLYWDRNEGVFLGKRDFTGERDKKDSEEGRWRERETFKELDESKRLFYVALTRAQKRLILVDEGWEQGVASDDLEEAGEEGVAVLTAPAAKKSKKKEIGPYEKEHWRRWILDSGRSIVEIQPPPVYSQEVFKRDLVLIQKTQKFEIQTRSVKPRLSVSELNEVSRCPLKYQKTYVRPDFEPLVYVEARDEGAADSDVLPVVLSQREIGKEVHRALELGDLSILDKLPNFESQPVKEWARQSKWMDSQKRAWSEFGFEVAVDTREGRQVVVGVLDRLVESAPKSFDVLDFKVTASPKEASSLRETYQNQLKIYAWAISKLAPQARDQVRARLIHFSKATVAEVEVEITKFDALETEVSDWAAQAAAIIRGETGAPKKSSLCDFCDHKPKCPAYGF